MSYMNQMGTKEGQDYVDFCTNLNSVGGGGETNAVFLQFFLCSVLSLCLKKDLIIQVIRRA